MTIKLYDRDHRVFFGQHNTGDVYQRAYSTPSVFARLPAAMPPSCVIPESGKSCRK